MTCLIAYSFAKISLPFAVQFPALREFVGGGKPVWGTCAGLIFLANKAVGEWVTNLYLACSLFLETS